MAYRWKNQPVNEIRENPGEYRGFNPQVQPIQMAPVGMRGNEPWRTQYDMPQTQRAPYMDAYEAPVDVPAENPELAQLKARLAEVNDRIAEIDAKYPNLKNGAAEWEIAAKRAEVGDMSAYDSMMGRGASAANAVSGIENELYNAYKLLYGLNAQNDYEQGAYANQIETALRRADEWSARNPNAKMPPIYADLKTRYEDWKAKKSGNSPEEPASLEVNNADETVNRMTSKIKSKKYSRKDEEEIQKWIDANPNNPAAKTLQEFKDAHRADTVESREEERKAREWREDWFKKVENLTPDQQNDEWNRLTKKQRANVLREYKWVVGKTGKEYLTRRDK